VVRGFVHRRFCNAQKLNADPRPPSGRRRNLTVGDSGFTICLMHRLWPGVDVLVVARVVGLARHHALAVATGLFALVSPVTESIALIAPQRFSLRSDEVPPPASDYAASRHRYNGSHISAYCGTPGEPAAGMALDLSAKTSGGTITRITACVGCSVPHSWMETS